MRKAEVEKSRAVEQILDYGKAVQTRVPKNLGKPDDKTWLVD